MTITEQWRCGILVLGTLCACTQPKTPAPAAVNETIPTRAELSADLKKHNIGTPEASAIEYPSGAAPTAAQLALGQALFADPRLSQSNKLACSTCHSPDKGFADGMVKSHGDKGNVLKRNTPALYNLAWAHVFTWDGEVDNLEDMSLIPNKREAVMGLPVDRMVARLTSDKATVKRFSDAYPKEGLTPVTVGKALAAYQRTIVSKTTDLDRYMTGDEQALTAAAKRGLRLFLGKGNCAACHDGVNLTDESFHNIGVATEDPGRGRLVEGEPFKHAFKTPGLRNVALTAPYMHDGSLARLEDVVAFYNAGGKTAGHDALVKPLGLTEGESADLVAFLNSLTDRAGGGTQARAGTDAANAPAAAGANTAGEGTLTGEFRFSSKPPKVGLVYFTEDHGLTQPLTIDQDGKQFLKQMAIASPGAAITFRNSANISHNIYANDSKLNVKFDLGLALPDSDFSKVQPVSWADGEVLKVGCKIHPNMRVYVASISSRYHQVLEFSDVVSKFELPAPGAKLTQVAIWLPQYERITVQIKPGEQKEIPLKHDGAVAGTLVLVRK